jgi:hypothetical protein
MHMTAEEHDIADMCRTKQRGTIFKTTYIYALLLFSVISYIVVVFDVFFSSLGIVTFQCHF